MSKTNFYVNIGVIETLALIKRRQSADLLQEEIINFDDGKIVGVLVFEKYYFRAENRAGLTVIVTNTDGKTNVKSIASGSSKGILFAFDWGAGDNFASSTYKILEDFVL